MQAAGAGFCAVGDAGVAEHHRSEISMGNVLWQRLVSELNPRVSSSSPSQSNNPRVVGNDRERSVLISERLPCVLCGRLDGCAGVSLSQLWVPAGTLVPHPPPADSQAPQLPLQV